MRFVFPSTIYIISCYAIIDTDTNESLPCIAIFVSVELKKLEYLLLAVTNRCFSGSDAVKSGFFALTLLKFIVFRQEIRA